MTAYWVEMVLDTADIDEVSHLLDRLTEQLREDYEGQFTYTASGSRVNLGLSCIADEPIENIPAKVVGVVRAAVHELGYGTPGWPEPVGIDDVRTVILQEIPAQTPTDAVC